MKEKMKLTELTKEELRQVSGGSTGKLFRICESGSCPCKKKRQQVFGLEASTGTREPIMLPLQ